jgi:HTH-like domain
MRQRSVEYDIPRRESQQLQSRRLNARSASNKSSSIFFSEPWGKSGNNACGVACPAGQRLRSHPSDDGVTVARRDRNRTHVPARRHQPVRLLLTSAPHQEQTGLRDAIQRLALRHRISALLRRDGWQANHKRVLRLMREDNFCACARGRLCRRRRTRGTPRVSFPISLPASCSPASISSEWLISRTCIWRRSWAIAQEYERACLT